MNGDDLVTMDDVWAAWKARTLSYNMAYLLLLQKFNLTPMGAIDILNDSRSPSEQVAPKPPVIYIGWQRSWSSVEATRMTSNRTEAESSMSDDGHTFSTDYYACPDCDSVWAGAQVRRAGNCIPNHMRPGVSIDIGPSGFCAGSLEIGREVDPPKWEDYVDESGYA